ncbi:trypsin-like serine peptidase [Sandaracinus amylolyticus]|uniref:trypsin-like serine peptidase n=1 Tax=Sandaracinus amylolyticus TaxID=927083 RepID=UPI001F205252|nr:trypsin-like peptidase domain-containing protein [Sandaracinus amylolyticus]
MGFCTATLIARDRIVTAAHCVPSGAPGAAASMHFFLPDEHAVTLDWRAVTAVLLHEGREVGADHAVLRLHEVIDAPYLTLSRVPPVADGRLEVVRASPHSDGTVFVRRERCLVMPQALSADRIVPSAIARIAGCTILPGNSGAPMLDDAGHVVAVVSTGLAPPGVAVLLAPWLTGPAPFVGTLSSLACLPTDVGPGEAPTVCAAWSRAPDHGLVSSAEARDAAIDVQREALAERLLEWERTEVAGRELFGWDLDSRVRGDRTWALPVPGCLDVAELERTGRIDSRGRFRLRVQVPAWQASAFVFGVDLRMVPITERVAWVWMDVRGRLDEVRESAVIRVRVRGPRAFRPRGRAYVPACRAEESER